MQLTSRVQQERISDISLKKIQRKDAKTQRRKEKSDQQVHEDENELFSPLCVFPPLRLCVESFAKAFLTFDPCKIITLFLLLVSITSCGASKNRSSSAPLKTVASANKNSSRIIMIDPGHGGEDPGARSKIPPFLVEKALNLRTAKELATLLQSKGYRVVLTRSGDSTVGLLDRVHFAQKWQADLFVSIHFNACSNPEVRGVEVYYFKNRHSNVREVQSAKLAKLVLDSVVRCTQSPSRGVRSGNLCVIRETMMPAILVEGGYLTSPKETAQLKSRRYLQQIAKGIANGIDLYYAQTS